MYDNVLPVALGRTNLFTLDTTGSVNHQIRKVSLHRTLGPTALHWAHWGSMLLLLGNAALGASTENGTAQQLTARMPGDHPPTSVTCRTFSQLPAQIAGHESHRQSQQQGQLNIPQPSLES